MVIKVNDEELDLKFDDVESSTPVLPPLPRFNTVQELFDYCKQLRSGNDSEELDDLCSELIADWLPFLQKREENGGGEQ